MQARRVLLLVFVASVAAALLLRGGQPPAVSPREERAERAPPPPAASPPADPGAPKATPGRREGTQAGETRSRDELRTTIQRMLAGKLADRELTSSDYDRLVDAVVRIRASQGALRNLTDEDADAAARNRHLSALRTAFTEIEEITGVPPASLGEVLGNQNDSVEAPR